MSKRLISRLSIILLSSLMVLQSCQTPNNTYIVSPDKVIKLKSDKLSGKIKILPKENLPFGIKAITGSIDDIFGSISPTGNATLNLDSNNVIRSVNFNINYSNSENIVLENYTDTRYMIGKWDGTRYNRLDTSGNIQLEKVSETQYKGSNVVSYNQSYASDYIGNNCICRYFEDINTNLNVLVEVNVDKITNKAEVILNFSGNATTSGSTTGGSYFNRQTTIVGQINIDDILIPVIPSPSPTPLPTPEPTTTPSDEPCDCSNNSQGFTIKGGQTCNNQPCDTRVYEGICQNKNTSIPVYGIPAVYNFDFNGPDLTFILTLDSAFLNERGSNYNNLPIEYTNIFGEKKSDTKIFEDIKNNITVTIDGNKVDLLNGKGFNKDEQTTNRVFFDPKNGTPLDPSNYKNFLSQQKSQGVKEWYPWADLAGEIPFNQTYNGLNAPKFANFISLSTDLDGLYNKLTNNNIPIPNKEALMKIEIGKGNFKKEINFKLKLDNKKKQGEKYKWILECQ